MEEVDLARFAASEAATSGGEGSAAKTADEAAAAAKARSELDDAEAICSQPLQSVKQVNVTLS